MKKSKKHVNSDDIPTQCFKRRSNDSNHHEEYIKFVTNLGDEKKQCPNAKWFLWRHPGLIPIVWNGKYVS